MTPDEVLEFLKARHDGTKTPEQIGHDLLLAIGLDPRFITPEKIREAISAQDKLIAGLRRIVQKEQQKLH